MSGRWTRRAWLRRLGISAALAPLWPLAREHARAQSPAYPRRLVVVFSPNGTVPAHFLPSGGETDFQLGSILEPLTPYRDYTTLLHGIRFPEGGPGNPHMQGPQRFLAGSGLLEGSEFTGGNAASGWGSHVSVDQVIAAALAGQTPHRSLHLGVLTGEPNVRSRLAYAGPAQPVPQQDAPAAVFDQLFGSLVQGAQSAQSAQTLERLRIARRSVIDLVKGQLDALRATHGTADQLKLDAHLQGVREIERRLATPPPAEGACSVPAAVGDADPASAANFAQLAGDQLDLLVAALRCDLTRVATLMLGMASSDLSYPALGIHAAHHTLSHAPDDDLEAQESLRRIHRHHAEQVAGLLERLAAVPEGDGTLLDHTAVLWGNEIAVGNTHVQHPVPMLLLGGSHGYFTRGRFLQLGDVSQSRLLVSLCHYMGLTSIQQFGNLDPGQGPLPGITR